jgi:hypothetical protein
MNVDEKLVNIMNEARMIAASEDLIFPMIDLMIQNRIDMACGRFQSGSTDFVADVAYITALKDLSIDLKSKQLKGNRVAEKIYNPN